MRATQVLFRRLRNFRLTTKQGPKDYYKGTGSGSMGEHTKWGGYRINYDKVRTYVVPPNLSAFKLTPFVTKKVQAMRGQYFKPSNLPISGRAYLKRWKKENGED